ncbi:MAG TPA: hypothetical protein VD789_02855 [Thermomicrobiales bacterium]|nr:hypothetical protein [Thermomicrobiales bacterium]
MDISAAISGIVLLSIGIGLAMAGLTADTYMHRGVEDGDQEPFVYQPTGDGLATNADLRVFIGGDLTEVADALSAGGFRYVRQPVSWSDVEPEPGAFDWSTYDQIVNELSRREIRMVAVVVDAPDWSRDPSLLNVADGPPVDPSTLGAFMEELTGRYDEAMPYVQIWDQPNRPERWGGTAATASGFLPYLAAGYNGARAGNPEVRIITPELAYRTAEEQDRADLEFLDALYRVGAEPFFDIVGIQLEGGSTSPDDRRISETRHNFSRAVLTRELMVANDDAATPIWATSFGWARSAQTSESEQAEFVIRALERSWVEWPWMGLMFQWAFYLPEGSGAEPYALVRSNGTATELYRRLASTTVQDRASVAETGYAPMDASSVSYGGSWQDQHLEGRTFRTTSQVDAQVEVRFTGTGATAVMRIGPDSGNVIVEVDGNVVSGGAGDSGDEWDLYWPVTVDTPIELASGLDYGEHTLTIRLSDEGALTLGGILIERRQPFVWPVVLLTVGTIISLFFGIRSLIMLVGRRSGFLPRPDDVELGPALPSMPDWRPSRRP